MKIKKLFTFLIIFTCLFSCSILQKKHSASVNEILPMDSFTFIKKTLIVRSCFQNVCSGKEFRSAGSGVAVAQNKLGTYVVTAGHICEDSPYPENSGLTSSSKYEILNMAGEKNSAEVVTSALKDKDGVDICMLFAAGVYIEPVKIAANKPKAGDKIYNLAAPYSIGQPGAVPILEGRYIGEIAKNTFAYSVPAAPGSSGSGMFNTKGELVGVLYAVYWRFHNISLANEFYIMKEFIHNSVRKYNKILDVDQDKIDIPLNRLLPKF